MEEPGPGALRRRVVLRTAFGALVGTVGCLSDAPRTQSVTMVLREGPGQEDSDLLASEKSAAEYNLQNDGVHWGSFPVTTSVGVNTVPDDVPTTAAEHAIEEAFATWNDVPEVGTVFASPDFDEDLTEITEGNGINEVVWSDLGDAVGRAHLRWAGSRLEEIDVEFNTAETWTTDPDASDGFDIQSIVTHELGHHGLDDVYNEDASEQTMYHLATSGETKKRTLESGDINGWQTVYGGRA